MKAKIQNDSTEIFLRVITQKHVPDKKLSSPIIHDNSAAPTNLEYKPISTKQNTVAESSTKV